MNPALLPQVRPARGGGRSDGAYADLRQLVALQFKARGFSFLPRQPIHSLLAGRHASRLRGRGLNFEELRRYLPGDDIRNMDWRATARLRRPHVRVYTEERDRPCLMVVDQRLGMFFGSRRVMKSVAAAEVAALAAWRTLAVGDRIGALVFDDETITEIRPHRSERQVYRILRTIVEHNHRLKVDPDRRPNPAMLNAALEQARRIARHDHLVLIVSDGSGADEETVRLATLLTEHNDVLSAFIHDPLEAELPDGGRLVAAEGELQLEADTGDRTLREGFARDFQQRLAWLQDLGRRRAAPLMPISTAEGVAEQVALLLGHLPAANPRTHR